MAKIGVVLSGCGVMDGAEIYEATFTLLSIDRAGHEALCMAPDVEQMHVIDHLTNRETDEKRNVLVESARTARGNIEDIAEVKASDIDALVIPGGFGAAKNLCDFAVKGTDCAVNPEVARLVKEVKKVGKPIGAICIAPAMLAKILGDEGIEVTLTIGGDKATAEAIEKMGCLHAERPATEICVDEANRVVTTPAYMCAQRIGEVAEGIDKLVRWIARNLES